jgi:hypothetical protein
MSSSSNILILGFEGHCLECYRIEGMNLDRGARNMVSKVSWSRDRRSVDVMTDQMNAAFQQLLEAWKRRDDARRANADIPELARARRDLDHARAAMIRTLNA